MVGPVYFEKQVPVPNSLSPLLFLLLFNLPNAGRTCCWDEIDLNEFLSQESFIRVQIANRCFEVIWYTVGW